MYEAARDRLATQLNFIDAVDGKIAMLVSMASGLLGIAAAVFALHATTPSSKDAAAPGLTGWQIGALTLGAVVYLGIVWFGIRAYSCRDWHVGPALDALWDQHKTNDTDDYIKWGVAVDTWLDFEHNLPTYTRKEEALRVVFVGAALETLVLVAAISLVATGT